MFGRFASTRPAPIIGVLLVGTLIFFLPACATAPAAPEFTPSDRESPGVGAGSSSGLRIGWTETACLSPDGTAEDADGDGVADACEHALAAAFAPAPDVVECFWDPDSRFGGWQAGGG